MKKIEEVKLEQFRAERELQLAEDAKKRKMANQLDGQDIQQGRVI